MNRPHVLDSSEAELAILNAKLDAAVLDEDTWEDATDEGCRPRNASLFAVAFFDP
jgi:hypothetical protein